MERPDNEGGGPPSPPRKAGEGSRPGGYSARRSEPRREHGAGPGRPRRGGDRPEGGRPPGEEGGYRDQRSERGPRQGYQGPRHGGGPRRDHRDRQEGGGARREGSGYRGRQEGGGAPRREGSGYRDRQEGSGGGPRREGGGYRDRQEGGGGAPRREGRGYRDRQEGDGVPRREGGRPQGEGRPRRDFGQRHENLVDPGVRREGGYSRRRHEGSSSSRRGEGDYVRAQGAPAQEPADHQLKLVATCALGLELTVGRELEALGLGPIARQNAQVSFPYSPLALAKANYWLRSADRVWLQLAEFPCRDFEELYQGVHSIGWADLLPRDAWFPVEAITTRSRLESEPSIQAVAKKAAVEKMSATYGRAAFSESGARFAIRVFIVYDRARVFIDSSGEGLHRRGYRTYNAKAPLRETVAAGLVLLSHWSPERELYDPMCGSGTILLEAASIGLRKAAGLDRSFAAQRWDFVGRAAWEQVHQEAKDLLVRRGHLRLYGSDVDGRVLKLAREHTAQAGFEGMGLNFQTRDVAEFASSRSYGVLITNPPYGKRLESPEKVALLTETMARVFGPLHETWSLYFFTAFQDFVQHYGREPERVRKIYNGTIPCQLYQYPGPRPPGLEPGQAGAEKPVRKRIPLNP